MAWIIMRSNDLPTVARVQQIPGAEFTELIGGAYVVYGPDEVLELAGEHRYVFAVDEEWHETTERLEVFLPEILALVIAAQDEVNFSRAEVVTRAANVETLLVRQYQTNPAADPTPAQLVASRTANPIRKP